ncbi:MAG: M1 family aminopeptidase [Acidobacteriota bacterium]
MEVPHVSYLISIACGEFAKIEDTWRGTPVQYFVKPGKEKQARRAFSLTPDMLDHFSETFGYAYPYPKYSQVVVEDFIFGGMENISATTLIDRCLMDERAALDYEPQDLVSHELARQWFGDLVTCKDWSHAWLNEGFATFSEVVYREHWRGEEDAGYHRLQQMQSYFERDRSERRPIVTKAYTLPMELFDQHIYEKGGLVLHMLRHALGDGPFWQSVQAYLHEFAGRNVQTEDLIGVINRVTGKNMEWFFDQWVFGAGFPEFEVAYAWDEKRKTATLTVDQKQKVDEKTPVFRSPVTVRFHGRRTVEERIEVRQAHQIFSFRLEEKPAFASFDPGFHILKKLTFKKPQEMLKTQLVKDPDWFGRVEAAQSICREGSREALEAVGYALQRDPFWGARVETAAALGATRQTLAFDALEKAVRKESHLDVIRAGALSGLMRLRDDRAWPLLRACAAPGGRPQGRIAAMRAMAAMARGREPQRFDVRQELERYLYDANFFAKFGAMIALELLDEPAAATELERIGQREVDGRIRMNARDIARALREGKSKGEEIVRLRGDLEKLREERRTLEDRVAKLEALAAPRRPSKRARRGAASKGTPRR